ncbi:ROK family transcriptional regulator [Deinococcus sp.]|uniref:ROK family transcriptional regulator n=1 Tax=Deinococcus sp. TaxID=47478 RepID=UPI0025D3FE12|nr:ROK family transcriptional regulator [Deinococcus sp.]
MSRITFTQLSSAQTGQPPFGHAAFDLAAIRSRHLLQLLERLWTGDLARVDLARELHLSRSAVSSLVAELLAAGLIREGGVRGAVQTEQAQTGQAQTGVRLPLGRRATLLSLNARAAFLLAIDLGASEVRLDLFDLRCTSLVSLQTSHDVGTGPAQTYARIQELCVSALAQTGVKRSQVVLAGAGVPGPVDSLSGQVVTPPNMPGWNGTDIAADLSALLGIPTLAENDANLGALAEYRFGAHRGVRDLLYLKLGTGIGAGVMVGGQLYRGARGGAGEIGHSSINEQGPPGRSGNPGALESYVAGQAPVSLARARRAAGAPSALPEPLNLNDLLDSPADPLAKGVWQEVGHHLGVALSTALNLFNPGAVVLGGRLAQAGEPLLQAVWASARSRTLNINFQGVSIDLSALGGDVGVLGVGAMLLGELLTPAGLLRLCQVAQHSAGHQSLKAESRAPPERAQAGRHSQRSASAQKPVLGQPPDTQPPDTQPPDTQPPDAPLAPDLHSGHTATDAQPPL